MTEAETYDLLTRIMREVFERNDIVATPELTAKDVVGWDSLRQVDIILAIEAETGAQFHRGDLDGLRNVGDLARIVMRETNPGSAPAA
jgi:acyl carrier protein